MKFSFLLDYLLKNGIFWVSAFVIGCSLHLQYFLLFFFLIFYCIFHKFCLSINNFKSYFFWNVFFGLLCGDYVFLYWNLKEFILSLQLPRYFWRDLRLLPQIQRQSLLVWHWPLCILLKIILWQCDLLDSVWIFHTYGFKKKL